MKYAISRRAAAVAISVILTATTASAQDAAKPFRIGAILSATGVYSHWADFIGLGLQVGVDQVNRQGGILGRKVELVVRDDASNPSRALLAAKELLGDQRVDALYPAIQSGTVLAVLPYTTEQKFLTITNGASPRIGDATTFPYSFQISDMSAMRVPAMVAAMKKLGGKTVGILTSTNPAMVAVGDVLEKDLKTKYGMAVAGYHKFAIDSKDLTPQLQALKDAGADIIALSASAREDIRVVMTGLQTLGWKAKVVTEPAALYGDLTQQMPSAVQDQFYAVNYRVATRVPGDERSDVQQFIEQMKAIRPIQNLAYAAVARDVIFLLKWAHETAQKEKGNTSSDSLRAVIEDLRNREYPKDYALVFPGYRYTSEDHTTNQADYSNFWALVRPSKPIDGTYEGEALPLNK